MSNHMREPRDVYYLRLAKLAATRGTCIRRRVGAVAVNVRGHELALGYNGVPSGFAHCNEGTPCPGASAPSGTRLDDCLAIHAEINLLAKCPDIWSIHTIYLTASPCFSCTKALISSGCRRLVFLEEYPQPSAKILWLKAGGRTWEQAEPLPPLPDEGSFY